MNTNIVTFSILSDNVSVWLMILSLIFKNSEQISIVSLYIRRQSFSYDWRLLKLVGNSNVNYLSLRFGYTTVSFYFYSCIWEYFYILERITAALIIYHLVAINLNIFVVDEGQSFWYHLVAFNLNVFAFNEGELFWNSNFLATYLRFLNLPSNYLSKNSICI